MNRGISRGSELQVAAAALALVVGGLIVRAAFDGVSQAGLGAGAALLTFGLVLELCARASGAWVAWTLAQRGWAAACALLGSPAVAVHALVRRRGPLAFEAGSLVGLLAVIAVLTLFWALASRGPG